jgi:hypothetical protein
MFLSRLADEDSFRKWQGQQRDPRPEAEVAVYNPAEASWRREQVKYYSTSSRCKGRRLLVIESEGKDEIKRALADRAKEFRIMQVHLLIHGANDAGSTCLGTAEDAVRLIAENTEREQGFVEVVCLWCYSKKHLRTLLSTESFKAYCLTWNINVAPFAHEGRVSYNVPTLFGYVHSGLNPEFGLNYFR